MKRYFLLFLITFFACDIILAASKPKFILSGDIGGTNARLRLTKITENKDKVILSENIYLVNNYPNFNKLISEFVNQTIGNQPISGICLAVAGPITNQKVKLTNSPWYIDTQELSTIFNLKTNKIKIINDFTGVGYGIDNLPPNKIITLQKGNKIENSVRVFMGSGTGLGVGYAYFNTKNYIVHPCEGGHTSFAPNNELQFNLRNYLIKKYPETDDISVEYLLSGQGICDIYEYLSKNNSTHTQENDLLQTILKSTPKKDKAKIIVKFALDHHEHLLSNEVLKCFTQILASKTSDVILSYFPQDGIYLVGGIINTILKSDKYQKIFLETLLKKDKISYLIPNFPIYLVDHNMIGLDGAENFAMQI